ncbi:MAG: hypothetical protein ACYCO3_13200 [Mycobacteriales bacterium]
MTRRTGVFIVVPLVLVPAALAAAEALPPRAALTSPIKVSAVKTIPARETPAWVRDQLGPPGRASDQTGARTRHSTNPVALAHWPAPLIAGSVWRFDPHKPLLATVAFLAPWTQSLVRWHYELAILPGRVESSLDFQPAPSSPRRFVASVQGNLTSLPGRLAELTFSWSGAGPGGTSVKPGLYTVAITAWVLPGGNTGVAYARGFELLA